jgi:hypothetical protein
MVKDAACVWWTKVKDSKADVQHRAEELLLTLKYCEAESIIVTGHSLFFRNLMRTYMCPDYQAAEPEHCAAITTKKLPNCGVAKCVLDFSAVGGASDKGGEPTATIRNVLLMFGTRIPTAHGKDKDEHHDSEEEHHDDGDGDGDGS